MPSNKKPWGYGYPPSKISRTHAVALRLRREDIVEKRTDRMMRSKKRRRLVLKRDS